MNKTGVAMISNLLIDLRHGDHHIARMPWGGPALLAISTASESITPHSISWLTQMLAICGFTMTFVGAVTTIYCNIPRIFETTAYIQERKWRKAQPPTVVMEATGVAMAQQGADPSPQPKYPMKQDLSRSGGYITIKPIPEESIEHSLLPDNNIGKIP